MIRAMLCGLALLVAGGATAQDYISSSGKLSDDAFYKLVACAAPPGTTCRDEPVRWPPHAARDLTVAVAEIRPTFPLDLRGPVMSALDDAIAQINSTGADLRMRRVADPADARIKIYLWDQNEGEQLRNMRISGANGYTLGAAHVRIWWNDMRKINRAIVVLSKDIQRSDLRSVLLEELVQSTGLLNDIDNAAYRNRSIFDEWSNGVIDLSGQDAAVLLRHYPARN